LNAAIGLPFSFRVEPTMTAAMSLSGVRISHSTNSRDDHRA
jgi:hypothetical protein